MHFADRLTKLIDRHGPICAGIDPRPSQLPPGYSRPGFGKSVARLLVNKVAAIKPQIAFLDDSRHDLEDICREGRQAGPDGALFIADIKRGDIGSTAEAYADLWFGKRGNVDAVTLNPYLGEESLKPWIEKAVEYDRGIFVLVRTSNPGAASIQARDPQHYPATWEAVAEMLNRLGEDCAGASGRSLIGAVVGLTLDPEEIALIRRALPNTIFLMPGYGAQGGSLEGYEAALDSRGGGVLVSASRSLTHPWGKCHGPSSWQEDIEAALIAMQQDIASFTAKTA